MLLPLLLSAFLTTSEAPQNDSIKTSWMNNVSVTGEKRQVMYRLDRRRIAASTNLAASGGTALDVLKTIPSVAIDADGNVTLDVGGTPMAFEKKEIALVRLYPRF